MKRFFRIISGVIILIGMPVIWVSQLSDVFSHSSFGNSITIILIFVGVVYLGKKLFGPYS